MKQKTKSGRKIENFEPSRSYYKRFNLLNITFTTDS